MVLFSIDARRALAILFVLASGSVPGSLFAQQATDGTTGAAPPSRASWLDRMYFSLNGASFDPHDNGAKLDFKSRAYSWGLSAGYVVSPHVGVDGEFIWFTGDYERSGAIIAGTTSNKVRIGSLGFNVNLRLSYPLRRVTPFVSLGHGFYSTDLMTLRVGDNGFSTEGPPSTENASGSLVTLGVAVPLRKNAWIDIAWRRLKLDVDFGPYSSGGIDAGGNFVGFSLRGGGH